MYDRIEQPAQSDVSGASGDPIEAMATFNGKPEQFLPQLLGLLCDAPARTDAAVLALTPTGEAKWIAAHPQPPGADLNGSNRLEQMTAGLSSAPIDQPRVVALQNSTGQQVWAYVARVPIPGPEDGQARALLCMFIQTTDRDEAMDALHRIVHAAQVIVRYETSQSLRRRDGDLKALSQSIRGLDAVNREKRFRPAAIALCNEIADSWGATRVSIGFLAGETVKLRGMSHTEDINRKMQLVQDLEAAMEECVDQDAEVLVPEQPGATTINRQARLFVEKHGPARMTLLPLRLHEDVVGAIAIEWPLDHVIDPTSVESLRLAANLFTARLHQFHLDDRWLGARMASSLRDTAAFMVGPKHTWAKLVAIAACVLIAFALLVKGDDTVDSSFTVQTTERQIITAPFAGTLLRVGEGVEVDTAVTGSDTADADQPPTVLAEMDTSELRVERAALEAQIADFIAQADAARGENDLAGVEVAMANVRRLQAQAELFDYRIDRSTITSQTTGVVIEGDLKQRINGPLEKGEVLFEIAPLDAMRAELLVPASRIGDVRSRLEHPDSPSRGELASASHPGDFIGFTVERIEPEAEVVDGNNVFRVRVSLDRVTDWLRPGVEGEARVQVARRSYAYLWTRDAVNWVRMKLWL